MARKLTRMTSKIHKTFSCPASFHCQSGRLMMSTRATMSITSEPTATTPYAMKSTTKPEPNGSELVTIAMATRYAEEHDGPCSPGPAPDRRLGGSVAPTHSLVDENLERVVLRCMPEDAEGPKPLGQ